MTVPSCRTDQCWIEVFHVEGYQRIDKRKMYFKIEILTEIVIICTFMNTKNTNLKYWNSCMNNFVYYRACFFFNKNSREPLSILNFNLYFCWQIRLISIHFIVLFVIVLYLFFLSMSLLYLSDIVYLSIPVSPSVSLSLFSVSLYLISAIRLPLFYEQGKREKEIESSFRNMAEAWTGSLPVYG